MCLPSLPPIFGIQNLLDGKRALLRKRLLAEPGLINSIRPGRGIGARQHLFSTPSHRSPAALLPRLSSPW